MRVGGAAIGTATAILRDMVSVPLDQLTTRQLLINLTRLMQKQQATLNRLDAFMADLTSSVADLQAAVDNMAVRFASQLQPLQQALADAQAQVATLELEDQAQQEALNTALQNAADAAEAIQNEVTELNSIGAAPDQPVQPVPVEELPPPPSQETPTGDQTDQSGAQPVQPGDQTGDQTAPDAQPVQPGDQTGQPADQSGVQTDVQGGVQTGQPDQGGNQSVQTPAGGSIDPSTGQPTIDPSAGQQPTTTT